MRDQTGFARADAREVELRQGGRRTLFARLAGGIPAAGTLIYGFAWLYVYGLTTGFGISANEIGVSAATLIPPTATVLLPLMVAFIIVIYVLRLDKLLPSGRNGDLRKFNAIAGLYSATYFIMIAYFYIWLLSNTALAPLLRWPLVVFLSVATLIFSVMSFLRAFSLSARNINGLALGPTRDIFLVVAAMTVAAPLGLAAYLAGSRSAASTTLDKPPGWPLSTSVVQADLSNVPGLASTDAESTCAILLGSSKGVHVILVADEDSNELVPVRIPTSLAMGPESKDCAE